MINRSVEDINTTLDNLIQRIEKLEWFKKEIRHDIDIIESQLMELNPQQDWINNEK